MCEMTLGLIYKVPKIRVKYIFTCPKLISFNFDFDYKTLHQS